MSRLKVGVVGAGALGRHHARILSELESVEFVAVAEVNAETGRRVAEACRTNWVSDYRELFGKVEAVSIVVPTTFHRAVGTEFLERGIPALIEKPLACDVQEAEQLVELAREKCVPLQVGHVERFNSTTTTAWKHISHPKYIRAERFSPYAFRSTDISVVHDVMIHDIDLVLDLVKSRVKHVDAFGVSILGRHEDCVQARLVFDNGCVADVAANRVHPQMRRGMHVWSATGCVNVDFLTRQVVSFAPTETLLFGKSPLDRAAEPGANIEQLKAEMFEKYIRRTEHPVPNVDALTAELSSFVECVRTGRTPLVDGEAGLRAMEVAELVLESVRAHQWDGQAAGRIGPFPQSDEFRRAAA